MGIAIKHPVPDRVKPSFVIFDIRALWRSGKFVVSGSQWMWSQQQHSSMRLWLLALTTVTPYWPSRRRSQQTSCSVWWILLPASLATLGSSIAAVCRGYCTTNSTGSMSPNEYNSSSLCWCSDVFMELLRCTWWKVAHKQPTSSVVNTCGPPVSGRWSFRGIEWTVMVVGVSLSRARRPGIRCQTVFVAQLWVLAFSGINWKHTFCEILTRRTQRIIDFFMRMRYINLHFTYLLT